MVRLDLGGLLVLVLACDPSLLPACNGDSSSTLSIEGSDLGLRSPEPELVPVGVSCVSRCSTSASTLCLLLVLFFGRGMICEEESVPVLGL